MKKFIVTLALLCVLVHGAFAQQSMTEQLVCDDTNRWFWHQRVRDTIIPQARDFMVSSRGGRSDTEYEYTDPDVRAVLDRLFNAINLSAESRVDIILAVLWFLNNKDPDKTGTIIVVIKPDPNDDMQIMLSVGRAGNVEPQIN